MPTVQTARGPIDCARLGTTLMHEHVFVLDREVLDNYPEEWGEEEPRIAGAVARMNELKLRGVDTIVDLTVLGLGRYIPRIERIAAQTELNIVAAGSYIGMDRFGIDTILPFEDRVATVARLCERGHASQMVLSHDAACFNHWLPERQLPAMLPRWNYLHIHNEVIPALRQAGVTDRQLDTMLIENPRRIFGRLGAY